MSVATTDLTAQLRASRLLCWGVIAVAMLRLLPVLLRWYRGESPAYPGQYVSRVLHATTLVGLMGTVLAVQPLKAPTLRDRIRYRAFLAVAVASFAAEIVIGY